MRSTERAISPPLAPHEPIGAEINEPLAARHDQSRNEHRERRRRRHLHYLFSALADYNWVTKYSKAFQGRECVEEISQVKRPVATWQTTTVGLALPRPDNFFVTLTDLDVRCPRAVGQPTTLPKDQYKSNKALSVNLRGSASRLPGKDRNHALTFPASGIWSFTVSCGCNSVGRVQPCQG